MRYRISEVKLNAKEYADREYRMAHLQQALERTLAKRYGRRTARAGASEISVSDIEVIRESIDARKKPDVKAVYTLDFESPVKLPLPEGAEYGYNSRIAAGGTAREGQPDQPGGANHDDEADRPGASDYGGRPDHENEADRPVIVGFGPCGIFAALTLAEAGLRPIVLERGQCVEQRMQDVQRFWKEGVLDPESNVQFGEGGAGTFSDVKLTTGIKDRRIRTVLRTFAEAGADPQILYQQKPHIGTDRLMKIIPRIRRRIESLGGEIRFGTRLTGMETEDGRITAILAETRKSRESGGRTDQSELQHNPTGCPEMQHRSADHAASQHNNTGCPASHTAERPSPQRIPASRLVLAIGHSARDTFRMLQRMELPMEPKAFSIGVRIEHPQQVIDAAQYGDPELAEVFGPASYKLHHRCENGRGVYTFCMCPGGRVINASSEAGGTVTNGMSESTRDSGVANSGLLVDVRPSDFADEDPLAGVEFQRHYEHLAYQEGRRFPGGLPKTTWGAFHANAGESCAGVSCASTSRSGVSCASTSHFGASCAGVSCASTSHFGASEDDAAVLPTDSATGDPVRKCIPAFAGDAIAEAMPHLGRRLRGFDAEDAVMTAVETRSSSPVRILRDEEMQSRIRGVYPAGEGPGYAGGIMSAAVDGIRVAEQIIRDSGGGADRPGP